MARVGVVRPTPNRNSAPSPPASTAIDLSGLSQAQQRELLAQLLRERAAGQLRYPMSLGQQGLWHAYRRDQRATPFNVYLPTRMRAALDVDALRKSIRWVAARHVCLHSVFSDSGGQLMQIVRPGLEPEISVVDLPGASDDAARRWVAEQAMRPFDLERGPLLRVQLLRLAVDDWIVVAVTHHIVVDFWSLIVILNELRTAYPSFARGHQPQLPPPQNNYAHFVQDQQALLDSPRGMAHRNYWQAVVAQAAAVIDLPTDKLRPAVFHNAAFSQALEFPPEVGPQINRLAARLKATPFSVVHAGLQVFLGRYSGQHSFLIGSPFSGRGQHHYEQTVGFFINMLPLAADLSRDPAFSRLVVDTAQQLMHALEHEAYPIAQIVHDASLPRDPSRSPLFQVSCTFEKSQLKSESGRAAFLFPNQQHVWDFGGVPQESFYVPHPTCHYDLEFVFEQTAGRLRGMIIGCQALFEPQSLQLMADNFCGLLQELVADCDRPISQVAWPARAAARGIAPLQVDQPPSVRPRFVQPPQTLCGMIARAVQAEPQQVALQFDGQQLTYAQLWHVARRLARQLAELGSRAAAAASGRGAGPRPADAVEVIPVCTSSGARAVVGLLAAQLTRAAAAAIDVVQPAVAADSLWHDARAALWLGDGQSDYVRHFPPAAGVDLPHAISQELPPFPAPPFPEPPWPGPTELDDSNWPRPGDAAYVVYTSGSTGQPKAVVIDHAAVCNTLAWRERAVPLSSADRVLMLLSHQFDAGLGIAWTSLSQGATLVWPETGSRFDPQAIVEQIIRQRITVLPAIPSLLKVLVAQPRFAECHSLRLIFSGGEAMPAELPSHVRQRTDARLWNFYGPSEAAIEAIAVDVTDHSPQRPVPLGRPIDNVAIVIVDEHRRPLPDTVPGELAIAGAGLARGYLNQPQLTAERFALLADTAHTPEGPVAQGTRLYLTGDRGRRLPDGQVGFLGRSDFQIKLRGYRIELGEIEAVLQAHPGVGRAAVKLVAAGTPQAHLLGFVTPVGPWPTSGLSPAENRLQLAASVKRFAGERLPGYKLPAAIGVLDSLPLTTSGKVDRAQLPESQSVQIPDTELLPAETPLEKYLATAWSENLGSEISAINVNYFEAGGSSLGAAMLTTQLSQQLGISIPTALLFDLADIGQLARRLAQLHGSELAKRFGEEAIALQLERDLGWNIARPAGEGMWSAEQGVWPPLLAPLKTTGRRAPLFLVHPPGGIVICYRQLAQHLDAEQPLVALRARGLHGPEVLPESLEAMAAEYWQMIRRVQPHGPYLLGGWSLGGLVAYEIAQQVVRSGEQVGRLILLDTAIPEGASGLVPAEEAVHVGLEYGIDLTLEQLGQLAPEEQLPYLWEHAQGLGVLDDQSPPEVVTQVLADLRLLFHHHVSLAVNYRVEPLAAEVDLFRPSHTPREVSVPEDRGWRYLARVVRVHHVPGHHHSMLQMPHVMQLAAALNALPYSGVTISSNSTAGSPLQ